VTYSFGQIRNLQLDDILKVLERHAIVFTLSGTARRSDIFHPASLRSPLQRGLYFISGQRRAPDGLTDAALVVDEDYPRDAFNLLIRVANPQVAYYRILSDLLSPKVTPGIHPTAVVSPEAQIDKTAYIGPHCTIEAAQIGAGCLIHASVTVMNGTRIGRDVTVEGSSVIGATGAAWTWDAANKCRIVQPQLGFTEILDGTFLGSNVTIVRGSVSETTLIGRDVIMAHGTKIGHGTTIGDQCHFANNVSIAGNVDIGPRCFVGSGAVVRPGVYVAEKTVIGAGAVVVGDTKGHGEVLTGVPAKPHVVSSGRLSGVPDISRM